MTPFYEIRQVPVGEREITVYRVSRDTNGNPRYVVRWFELASTYDGALAKIKAIGGKAYRGKWISGGLVFQSYNVSADLQTAIDA